LFLLTFVSAGVELSNSISPIYNRGDVIRLPLTFSFDEDMSDIFVLNLNCNEGKVEFYKEYIYLSSGESVSKTVFVPLIKDLINNLKGECSINYNFGGEDFPLGESFKISDKINFNFYNLNVEYMPGDSANLRGEIFKENGELFEGKLNMIFDGGASEDFIFEKDIISGAFNFGFNVPSSFSAGPHLLVMEANELDSEGNQINYGKYEGYLNVASKPTNLEIVLDETGYGPGDTVSFKAVLHDQTGIRMDSSVSMAVKNDEFEIVKKFEGKTDTSFNYMIEDKELPGMWEIIAYSGELSSKINFNIKEKPLVKVEILNETLILTNIGNVFYNDSIKVKIGDEVLEIPVEIPYDSFVKYKLSAPKGVYDVEVEGVSKQLSLTGRAIDLKKVTNNFSGNSPSSMIFWIFLILILGFILTIIIKRGYKRAFFGRARRYNPNVISKRDYKEISPIKGEEIMNSIPKAEISLSIKGSKQNAGIISLFIKNYSELSSGEGNVKETLASIFNFVNSKKGFLFQNGGSMFFVFAPSRTKTFKNESTMMVIAKEIQELLKDHNKKFKLKFNYGISLNYGTIVLDEKEMKFMSMGTLLTDSRKISNSSNEEELLISESVKERLGSDYKFEKKDLDFAKVYVLKEIIDRSNNSTFIKGFLARQERDKAKRN